MTTKITLAIRVVGTSTIEVDEAWYREQKRRGDLEYELERTVDDTECVVTVTEPDGSNASWNRRIR